MRVIDHRRSQQDIQKKRRSLKPVVVFLLILAAMSGIIFFIINKDVKPKEQTPNEDTSVSSNNNLAVKSAGTKLKTFSGAEFNQLYNSIVYPNTTQIKEKSYITGNEAADDRIRAVAVSRGYGTRTAPVTDAFREAEPNMKLQQRAVQPWLELKKEAKNDGLNFGISAAYRSADDQRVIFIDRLSATGVTANMIATGNYDAQVSQILRMTAIPGYSRHHTGYTIDIACEDEPYTSFDYTQCFKWLSANNYEKTKKHGWIPSYPEGSGPQGPDPESWEYVWVGVEQLTE